MIKIKNLELMIIFIRIIYWICYVIFKTININVAFIKYTMEVTIINIKSLSLLFNLIGILFIVLGLIFGKNAKLSRIFYIIGAVSMFIDAFIIFNIK
jgi:hypothetical protein